MAEHVIEYDCQCETCNATGLYVGFAEQNGAAVVCANCKGSGKQHIKITYSDFEGRQRRPDIRRVYRVNPGIGIGEGNGHRLEDFGGLEYYAWLADAEFAPGTEDRRHTCPAWFYQSADYAKKPDWSECNAAGRFSDCKHFACKQKCWERWDNEQSGLAGQPS